MVAFGKHSDRAAPIGSLVKVKHAVLRRQRLPKGEAQADHPSAEQPLGEPIVVDADHIEAEKKCGQRNARSEQSISSAKRGQAERTPGVWISNRLVNFAKYFTSC